MYLRPELSIKRTFHLAKTLSNTNVLDFRCLQRILSSQPDKDIPVIIYDPVHNQQEKEIIKQLGYNVLAENDVKRHYVSSENTKVLFYLPHCPKTLTNNILKANWCRCSLASAYILGNSFDSVVNNLPNRIIR